MTIQWQTTITKFYSIEIKVGKFLLYSLGSKVRLKYMHSVQKTPSLCHKVHNLQGRIVKNKVLMLQPRKSKTKGKVDRMWRRMDPAVL